ncbi:aminotransferase class I/II-fold pyridoxal phosphate-dependent enzyme [Gemella cuniculi]|uniref:aminotransferase class I/II-fold pyridoxal phosphate-dependent enzyme n=1 Tax=Gemella cuniculi TaxID=150240 RepID=UPI00041A421E|nr:aminotransferase class I/II-fold pyridoxal phosphate-dependent enzyme [Gemella cuniculi]
MEIKKSLENRFNTALANLTGSPIREFDRYASSIDGIIKLTLGEPDFDTAIEIKEAAKKALDNNRTHYSVNNGIIELRTAWSKNLKDRYNLNYSSDEVIVTIGASAAIEHTISAITNEGDTILVVTPYFSAYEGVGILNKCNIKFVDTVDNKFKLSPQVLEKHLEENKDAKAILINYPNNPSGVSYTREEVKELADVLKKYDIFVVSDEIYGDLTYNYKHTSLAEFIPEQTVHISGLSKSHAMTGWRVGFIAAPQAMIKKIGVFHLFTVSGAATFIQDAAVEALTSKEVDKYNNYMLETYRERKDYMVPRLRELGFEVPEIDGAFYIFAKIPKRYSSLGAMEFCKLLAKEAKVGVIPGTAFGKAYDNYFRISYATSIENIKESVERISQFINK